MTADEFRTLALSLPEATEGAHMGHADFRVRNRIFASLGPNDDWGMVKLTPAQQAEMVGDEPEAFEPFNGAWGRRGATKVHLEVAPETTVREGLIAAWRNTAPKGLTDRL